MGKNIILFFRDIKASIKQNPVIYGVFAFFYIFSTIVAIYVFGKYSSNLMAYDDYDDTLTTFTIECSRSYSEISEGIKKNTSDKNIEYIRLVFSEDSEDVERDYTDVFDPPLYAAAYAHSEFEMVKKFFQELGLNNLNINDFVESDNSAIIVENAFSARGDNIEIQGVPHKIVGRLPWCENGVGEHLVPFNSVLKNNFYISYLSIKYSSISDAQQLDEIKKTLEADFPGMAVSEPVLRDYNRESILSIGNILVYLVIALSAVNFIYIFKSILEKRAGSHRIYSLCGCSRAKIVMYETAEILMTSAILSFLATLLFKFAVSPFIISLEPLLKYTFTRELYLAAFVISVLLSFTVLMLEFIFVQNRRLAK